MNDHVSGIQAVYFALTLIACCLSIIAILCPRRGPQGRQGLPGKDAKPAEVHIKLETDLKTFDSERVRVELDRMQARRDTMGRRI